ncbi:hypothetical protein [Nonomuraea sp. 10N515B]|uniref:hypothetical protein n=1 Tax=Nonomuraea sp. 10N515B TaxID=3457422 RepID=UPI003FCD7DE0
MPQRLDLSEPRGVEADLAGLEDVDTRTGWREGTPSGQSVLSIYHDHARIASSYALAEPANW